MDRGGPTGCDLAGSQSRTVPSAKPATTRPPSPRNAAQVARDEAVSRLARTSPVAASRSLTVPSPPTVRKSRPSGRNPPDPSSIMGSPIACPRVTSQSRVEGLLDQKPVAASRARPSGRNSIRIT